MAYNEKKIEREYIGKDFQNVMELPDLIGIQTSSYERFLQRDKSRAGGELDNAGLEEVFRSTFPIESPNGDMLLEYERYNLDEDAMKYSELECKMKGLTYAVPLKARINLVFQKTGEIRQKEIYLGDIPLMTDRGTFDPPLSGRHLLPREGRLLRAHHPLPRFLARVRDRLEERAHLREDRPQEAHSRHHVSARPRLR
jgi:hypothetical protein